MAYRVGGLLIYNTNQLKRSYDNNISIEKLKEMENKMCIRDSR